MAVGGGTGREGGVNRVEPGPKLHNRARLARSQWLSDGSGVNKCRLLLSVIEVSVFEMAADAFTDALYVTYKPAFRHGVPSIPMLDVEYPFAPSRRADALP